MSLRDATVRRAVGSQSPARAGFGIYYMICMVILLGLAAVSMMGLRLQRQTARNAADRNRTMRAAGESYMALALGLVQGWANAAGGPLVPETGQPLYRSFRQYLMDPALDGEALHLEFDLAARLGAALDGEGMERYPLRDNTVRVTIRRPQLFEGYAYHGGGTLVLEALVTDRQGRYPPLLFSRTHRYTVTSPTVPPPFDRLVLAIRDPRSLLGTDRDRDIRRFTDRLYAVNRRFNQTLSQLATVRERLAALPGGVDTAPLARALQALRDGRPDPRSIVSPPHNPAPASRVLVAYPNVGSLELASLAVRDRLDEVTREIERLEEAWAATEEGIDRAVAAAGRPPFDLAPVEVAVRAWQEGAVAVWGAYQAGLDVYNRLDDQRVRFQSRESFAAHWAQFDLAYWRRKAHYRIEGGSPAEMAAALARLGEAVRPLNGIVFVDNDPDEPAERLVLRGDEHGLEGRFVLAARGTVTLEGFRPQHEATAAATDRSRALVVAGGDAIVRGRNQVALFGHGRLTLEASAVIQGGLYARTVIAPGDFQGTLEALADEGSTHRFRARQHAARFRDSHLLVAIDPVATRKSVEG